MRALQRILVPLAGACLLTTVIWLLPQPSVNAPYLSTEQQLAARKQFLRGPVKEPSDWFMIQRVGPDGTLNMDAVNAARERARTMRSQPRELDEAWTFEGPTNIGGRITGLAIHPDQPDVVYAAGAIGGVFKSTDGGNNFVPVFEEDFAQSGGAIAVDPNNPDRIWYGSGEVNASGDSYPGNGIYLSEDAGATWSHKGLPESYHIGRIQIDPTNSDRIFVAAAGKLFGFNEERGVYRTLDGGDTWENVLYLDDSTGCVDLELNQLNPDTVFAVFWERYRLPSQRQVAGDGSGVWRSTDGGDTWEHLLNGLPNHDNVGRGSLALSPTHPDALILTHTDHPGYFIGAWRSMNGGDSWEEIGLDGLGSWVYSSFGWYFGESIIKPGNPAVAYIGGVYTIRTTDGGQGWNIVFDDAHVDHHAFYIDPNNPDYIMSGHDGGVNRSTNQGASSFRFGSLAATQFYAITHDPSLPHRLYGGTQDNGSMRTPDGNTNTWEELFGGDGFYCLVDPRDSDVMYVSMQWGAVQRSLNGGDSFWSITGWGGDRTNWMTPYTFDPFNYDRLFVGTYRVWRTDDQGDSWDDISPDLTDGDDPGNLTYGTITSISASPVEQGQILVGTDDANLWYTDNYGAEWYPIDDGLPDMWISRVATHPDSGNVFHVAFSGHRVSDPTPHLYRSDDYGTTWHPIVGDSPEDQLPDGPINDIIVDPHDTSRLYVGTDFGVFASYDYGSSWEALGTGLPMSAVFDIDFIESERRLIAGTHGRSMYSIQLSPVTSVETEPEIPSSQRLILTSYPNPFNASTTVRVILPEASTVSVAIYDLLGRRVAELARAERLQAGGHEWHWDARHENGSPLASGTYIVQLQTESQRMTRRIQLLK